MTSKVPEFPLAFTVGYMADFCNILCFWVVQNFDHFRTSCVGDSRKSTIEVSGKSKAVADTDFAGAVSYSRGRGREGVLKF